MTHQEFIHWLDGYLDGLGDQKPDVSKIRDKRMEVVGSTGSWLPTPQPRDDTRPAWERKPWERDIVWCGTSSIGSHTTSYTHTNDASPLPGYDTSGGLKPLSATALMSGFPERF